MQKNSAKLGYKRETVKTVTTYSFSENTPINRGINGRAWMASVLALAVSAFCATKAFAQSGGSFDLKWSTIDGGGGASGGGTFSIAGTIGQPDAGRMSGGNFSLEGGFWSIFAAVATPGAPLLRIFLTATNTVGIGWPAPSTGFSLQGTINLNPPTWAPVTNVPAVAGSENQVIISLPAGNRFFRLTK